MTNMPYDWGKFSLMPLRVSIARATAARTSASKSKPVSVNELCNERVNLLAPMDVPA